LPDLVELRLDRRLKLGATADFGGRGQRVRQQEPGVVAIRHQAQFFRAGDRAQDLGCLAIGLAVDRRAQVRDHVVPFLADLLDQGMGGLERWGTGRAPAAPDPAGPRREAGVGPLDQVLAMRAHRRVALARPARATPEPHAPAELAGLVVAVLADAQEKLVAQQVVRKYRQAPGAPPGPAHHGLRRRGQRRGVAAADQGPSEAADLGQQAFQRRPVLGGVHQRAVLHELHQPVHGLPRRFLQDVLLEPVQQRLGQVRSESQHEGAEHAGTPPHPRRHVGRTRVHDPLLPLLRLVDPLVERVHAAIDRLRHHGVEGVELAHGERAKGDRSLLVGLQTE